MGYIINRCLWCDDILPLTSDARQVRSDKKFCSARCRGRYNRWLHNLNKHERKATAAIKAAAEYLQHPKAQQQAVEVLARLRDLIQVEATANGLREVE